MSTSKNTPKNAAANDVVEEIVESSETTVPAQMAGSSKATIIEGAGEDGRNLIVISDDDIVDEPSLFQKVKTVVKRNRKLFVLSAVTVAVGVLVKIASGVDESDEETETTDEADDSIEPDTTDLAV